MKSLSELYSTHQGKVSDKWGIYLPTYDRLFSPYRAQPVRLLEVGVQNGGSLEIWSKYFVQAQKLIGCDINPACSALQYEDPRVAIVVGDANTDAAEHQITSHAQQFDIVIDDGSHRSSDIIKTFVRYFPKVVDGGIFVAEDLHCSYWQEFEGGLHDPYSSMSFFKLLADVVNHEHWGTPQKRVDLTQGIQKRYGVTLNEEILSCIHSVEFVNSICVIRKQEYSCNQLGKRIVTGQLALVSDHGQIVANQHSVALDQSQNYWSKISHPPGELVKEYESSITERDRQIASLNQTVTERDRQIASLNQAVEALRNSTSWRITAPLRFIVHQVKRAKYVASVFPAVVRQAGGVRSTSAKVWRVLQREGIQGLRFRWRAYHSSESSSAPAGRNDYQEWIRRYDTLDDDRRRQMRDAVQHWQSPPLISVVMPTYNADPLWLTQAIESVQAQLYPHWELCIADDASTDPRIRPLLEGFARKDERIKVQFRPQNGHISEASNTAIEMATGEWMALLDHDDLLHQSALYNIAAIVQENDDTDIIYSDEDKLDYDGNRCMPLFKPDWSPHLALSQAYLGHLVCYRSSLVREIGGCRANCDGAQDYDLWLRASLKARRIVHIPKVLYHWRMHAESTAATPDSKPYAHKAGRIAVENYVKERYPSAPVEVVDGAHTFTYELKFNLREDLKVSIIIPTRNRVDLLRPCIQSILEKSTWQNFEIIVLDNGSDDQETIDWMKAVSFNDKRVRVISADIPFNWSRLNNIGASNATGGVYVFLNNDTVVISPDWLEKLAGYALLPDAGVVGALLQFEDGTIQHSGVVVGMGGWADHVYRMQPAAHRCDTFISPVITRNTLAVTGACAAISADRFHEIGGFDEEFIVCGSDVEICLRTHARGWYNIIIGEVRLFHFESKSRDPAKIPQSDFDQSKRKYEPFRTKNYDPFFNPNLSLMTTKPTLAHGGSQHA